MCKKTKLAVIGNPVAQSPSPEMFTAAIQDLGLNATYERILYGGPPLQEFIKKIKSDEIHGCNVTIPHKETILSFLDELTLTAKKIGAVNTVFHRDGKVVGHNTDGNGFVASLLNTYDLELKNTQALLFGAGGAAKAIAYTLKERGLKSLVVANRDFQFQGIPFEKINLLINATPLGMIGKIGSVEKYRDPRGDSIVGAIPRNRPTEGRKHGFAPTLKNSELARTTMGDIFQQSQMDWQDLSFLERLPKGAIVCDIVANPIETSLLKRALALGHLVLPGHGMLLYQGVEAFEIFLGCKPNVEVMKQALLKALM